MPVPKAFDKASLPANCFAKYLINFSSLYVEDILSSSSERIFLEKDLIDSHLLQS